ncbi:MAG: adenylate/guanylate cyclase domain-containing protein [Halothece sp.]
MSSKSSSLLSFFQARLSRRITFWVFLSIIAIEIIILIPSYWQREQELLEQQKEVSRTVVNSVINWQQKGVSEEIILSKLENLVDSSVILGITIYRSNGDKIATFGKSPELELVNLRNINNDFLCGTKRNSHYYDVAWSGIPLGANYIFVVRHGFLSVQEELYAYVGRIALLVLIIAAFVTSVTMVVLGKTVIIPILRLQDDLRAVGEALKTNENNPKFYSLSMGCNDELGEVMQAFNEMYSRVSWEISERKSAEKTVRLEQEKSERLLLNILPEAIAAQLKNQEQSIAEAFSDVTILFADLVGFTPLSANTTPEELVKLLNKIFSRFDSLTEKHGLEKIKTIGDAYMVASGLPNPRQDHAEAIAEMALDMQEEIAQLSRESGEKLSLRIGINTGSVVAGVIGIKKFTYDLWGDTVNLASRMESHGLSGKIQVTANTYCCLQQRYSFEERGEIFIKGKGKMRTYWLTGRKASLPLDRCTPESDISQ